MGAGLVEASVAGSLVAGEELGAEVVGALVPGAPDGDLDGSADGPVVGLEEGLAVAGLAVVATVVSSKQMSRYSSAPSPQSSSPARVGESNGPSKIRHPRARESKTKKVNH